jgi:hypothetical protein
LGCPWLAAGDRSSPPFCAAGYESAADYLAYVRDPGNGFVRVEFPVDDGIEISSRTGR